ncbi:uncharacterized protein LOC101455897 isoform X2 [Ceratitis capitata]|uniref:uncharacterized protein LOC101455897 isoform X2 n=1 Tax=Ceratitis capitata TaxID=7213 RepID=UPI000A11F987|nr:uncharacterized protein LOC101455897 isoform X2 [Ceratitis capitata]
MQMLSFAGFTGLHRHYGLIRCQVILFGCVLLLLLFVLFILLWRPSYMLTNGNDNINNNKNYDNDNDNDNGINTNTLRKDGFRTQNCNKLVENPNSQQEDVPPPPKQPINRSAAAATSAVVIVADGGMVSGLLDDHNNLLKSRIAAGRDFETKSVELDNISAPERPSFTANSVEIIEKCANNWIKSEVSGENDTSNGRRKINKHKKVDILENLLKRRHKRIIIFSGSGVVKFVVGVSFPIMLADKTRSMGHYYNLQVQYPLPTTPIYWWNFFNSSSFAARRQQRQAKDTPPQVKLHPHIKHDVSREFIYEAIEHIYERHGIPGEACLLQAICEVSQLPFHAPQQWENNLAHLWHALLNAVLVPTVPNVDMKYLHASQAGRFGVDCQRAFGECPRRVNGWLRNVVEQN